MGVNMRKSLAIFGVTLVTAGFMVVMSVTEVAAGSVGCCMARKDTGADTPWVQIGDDFDQCQRLNRDRDGKNDDIRKPTGRVQWIIDC